MRGSRWVMVVPVSMMSSTNKQCFPRRVLRSIPDTFSPTTPTNMMINKKKKKKKKMMMMREK